MPHVILPNQGRSSTMGVYMSTCWEPQPCPFMIPVIQQEVQHTDLHVHNSAWEVRTKAQTLSAKEVSDERSITDWTYISAALRTHSKWVEQLLSYLYQIPTH
eukprot:1145192-Pelagomonas_calceolata.AAC.2